MTLSITTLRIMTQQNDIQHHNKWISTLSIMTSSITLNKITTLRITINKIKTLSMMALHLEYCYAEWHVYWMSLMLNVIYAVCHKYALHAECCFAECRNTERRYAECHYAECHYAECCYADCRGAILLGASVKNKISLIIWTSRVNGTGEMGPSSFSQKTCKYIILYMSSLLLNIR
jgi:hypothetical protein